MTAICVDIKAGDSLMHLPKESSGMSHDYIPIECHVQSWIIPHRGAGERWLAIYILH